MGPEVKVLTRRPTSWSMDARQKARRRWNSRGRFGGLIDFIGIKCLNRKDAPVKYAALELRSFNGAGKEREGIFWVDPERRTRINSTSALRAATP